MLALTIGFPTEDINWPVTVSTLGGVAGVAGVAGFAGSAAVVAGAAGAARCFLTNAFICYY
jgi:hypothetical protein